MNSLTPDNSYPFGMSEKSTSTTMANSKKGNAVPVKSPSPVHVSLHALRKARRKPSGLLRVTNAAWASGSVRTSGSSEASGSRFVAFVTPIPPNCVRTAVLPCFLLTLHISGGRKHDEERAPLFLLQLNIPHRISASMCHALLSKYTNNI